MTALVNRLTLTMIYRSRPVRIKDVVRNPEALRITFPNPGAFDRGYSPTPFRPKSDKILYYEVIKTEAEIEQEWEERMNRPYASHNLNSRI